MNWIRPAHAARTASAVARLVPVLAVAALAIPVTVTVASTAAGASTPLTLTVTSTADLDAVGPGAGPCLSTNGHCTLRAAIEIADVRQVPVSIILPADTFVLSLGQLEVDDAGGVTVTGKSTGATSISGGDVSRVFQVAEQAVLSLGPSTAGATLALDRLTVKDGATPGSGIDADHGGCIDQVDANDLLILNQAQVSNCLAFSEGGGIFAGGQVIGAGDVIKQNVTTDPSGGDGAGIYLNNAVLQLSGSSFIDNSTQGTSDTRGGGIYSDDGVVMVSGSKFTANAADGDSGEGGAAYLNGPATFTGDTFSGNQSTGGAADTSLGGALYVTYGLTSVVGGTFANNVASGSQGSGGAIYNGAIVQVIGSHFSTNHATGVTGEGIGGAIENDGNLSVTGATFAGNVTTGTESLGGAISDDSESTITGSTFSHNTALNGFGGAVISNGDGTVIVSSTFDGNRVTGGTLLTAGDAGYGGAISFNDTGTLLNSRLIDNHASQGGGGLYEEDTSIMSGTTISDNTAIEGAGIYSYWVLAGSGNVIADNKASGAGAEGGGIFNVGFRGGDLEHRADLTDSVIAGNVAPVAPGVDFQGGPSVSGGGLFTNDLIEGNHTASNTARECANSGGLPPVSGGGNVIGDTTCQLNGTTDRAGSKAQGLWLAAPSGLVAGRHASTFGHGGGPVKAIAAAPGNQGYWEVTASGAVKAFGSAHKLKSATGKLAGGVAVGIATTLDGTGAWVASSTGAVVALGTARSFGQAAGTHVIGIERSVDAGGYELLLASGKVLAFGDAPHLPSTTGIKAAGFAMTPDGQGYWEATTTGHVYNYGDAKSFGSVAAPGVIGVFSSPNGRGFLVVTDHGKVFAKGDAHSPGATSGSFAAAAAT